MATRLPPKDIIYVFVQLILFILFFLNGFRKEVTDYDFLWKITGLLMAISGVVILFFSIFQLSTNLTPFPSPKESSTLVQSGIYKFVRHPIYTGILLMALGISMYFFNAWKFAITGLLQILFYFKSAYEEKLLIRKFKEYEKYRENTGRFFPVLFRF